MFEDCVHLMHQENPSVLTPAYQLIRLVLTISA